MKWKRHAGLQWSHMLVGRRRRATQGHCCETPEHFLLEGVLRNLFSWYLREYAVELPDETANVTILKHYQRGKILRWVNLKSYAKKSLRLQSVNDTDG